MSKRNPQRQAFEYRVRIRRVGSLYDQTRIYQRSTGAERCARWYVYHRGTGPRRIESIIVERRPVGDWAGVDEGEE